jgi:hypothetical protein
MSKRLISVLAALAGILVVAVPTVAGSDWSAPIVIYDGDYSQSSLAVDAHGHAHVVARGDTGVWYLTNKGGSWTRERLTTDYVRDGYRFRAIAPLITIDRSVGKLVVVYQLVSDVDCDPGCFQFEYITRTGTDWSSARGIGGILPRGPLSIAARGGDIAIAAWDDRVTFRTGVPLETMRILYLHKADGWSVHRVAGGGNASSFGPPSLALDSAGRPRIAFQRNDHITFAKGATTSGTFSLETVAAESGRPSLALDPHDRPMIVWPAGDGVHYARRAAGWYSSMVMPGQYDARLVVDGNGAHVVSSDGANGVWYGSGTTSANWTSQQLTDVRIDALAGIGVAPNGRVDIAYQVGHSSPRIWFTHTTN